MIKTQVTWGPDQPTSEEFKIISDFLEDLIVQGKTDGVLNKSSDDINITVSERTWVDADTAQLWVNFINQFEPESAVVINNEQ